MRISPILVALAALIPTVARAQADKHVTTPRLLAGPEGSPGREPLRLAKANITVVITAGIAETTMTLTFANDTPRQLEGELVFPLPENATVSGYGLDVNGSLIDGVPVERQKARVTYETETRKRVDPGLVEQTVGNNFRTRVYPIPPNGARTIKLQYVSDVTEAAEGPTFRLPLKWDQSVDEASVRVEVTRPDAPPVARGDAGLAFAPFEDRFIAERTYKNLRLADDLIVALPAGKERDGVKATVEKRLHAATMEQLLNGDAARVARNDYYFVLHDAPPAPAAAPAGRGLVDAPRRIGLLWDASLSRLNVDKAREFAALRAIVATLDKPAWVDVVVFRDQPDPVQSIRVDDGGDGLIDFLTKATYDGGTNLSLLPVVRNRFDLGGAWGGAKPPDYAYWLLFSDGIADLGPDTPAKLDARLFAISDDAKSNHTLLRRLAEQTGGAYLNLQRVTDADVTAALTGQPYSLLRVEADNPNAIADLYPRGGAQPVPANGRVTVTGKLTAPEATVSLLYGVGGVVTHRTRVTLRQADATQTGLVSRFWAQRKVADLSADVEGNGDALAAVGKEFNLVTPNTSLLVLENVDQYLQHQIVPPKTAGKLYDDFVARVDQHKVRVGQTREERIRQVLAMWDERVKWWEAEHKYPPGFVYKAAPAKPQGGVAGAAGPGLAVAAAPDGAEPENATRPASSPAAPAPHPTRAADITPREVARQQDLDGSLEELAQRGVRGTSSLRADAQNPRLGLADDLRKSDVSEPAGATVAVAIKAWDPNVPYLKAMRESGDDGQAAYEAYLKQRPAYLASPAFYFDCAEYLFRHGQKRLATRVLTNVAELKLEDAQLLRIVAHKLNQTGDRELAINLFERVLKLRPEEPQSHRDLALALSDRADASAGTGGDASPNALHDYARALDLLNHVVMTRWDRFDGIEVTALIEANRVLARLQRYPDAKIDNPLDPRLVRNLDCDARIVLTWDADLTDVDLWVTEPSGEKCDYSHNRTTIGGLLSRDFTQGYGPEEYCLRHAMPGQYKIQANYYGSSQTTLVGPCTVQATVITNFGRPNEQRQTLTLRLDTQKQVVDVGTVRIGEAK